MARRGRRSNDEMIADTKHGARAAADLVARGKEAWDSDELLRLAGEAVIGRIADAAGRLPDEIRASIVEVPWDDIRDIRILVDHIYHRVDYEALWETLERDIPFLLEQITQWRASTE
jgi:uncharacterized protein with HEPN domain